VHDAEGRLVYAGNVGTGFDEALLRSLMEKLEALETDKDPAAITREPEVHEADAKGRPLRAPIKITNPDRLIDPKSKATSGTTTR
jgi:ATP-dependent DNA ligase